MRISLGDEVYDTITGFAGIVIAVCHWYHGCTRVTVQPQKLTSEGRVVEAHTFDEPQLALITSKQHVPLGKTGGPRPEPTRNADVR